MKRRAVMNRFAAVQTLQTAHFLAFLFVRFDRELKQNFCVGTFNFLPRELKCFLERQHVIAQ